MPLPVLALMLVVFGLTTGEFVIAGILPDVAADLAVSIPAAGLLVTAYALGMIVGGPVVTVLTARVARKPLIVGLVAVSVIGNLGSVLAPTHALVLASRFVAGLVVATFFAVAIGVAVEIAHADRRASAVAQVTLGLGLGIVLGTPIGTAIGQQLGWRATFLAVALFGVLALAAVVRFVPARAAVTTGSIASELRVLNDHDVRVALLLTALGNVGVVTVFTYLAPLLTDVSGFAPAAVPALLLLYGAGAIGGNIVGGRLADRALLPSLIALLLALAAVLALMWLVRAPVPTALLTFVLGSLAFAVIPGMQTRVLATAQAAPTLAIAVNASGFQVAAAFAGLLGGWVIDSRWGLPAIYPVAAVLTLAGAAVAGYARRRDAVGRT